MKSQVVTSGKRDSHHQTPWLVLTALKKDIAWLSSKVQEVLLFCACPDVSWRENDFFQEWQDYLFGSSIELSIEWIMTDIHNGNRHDWSVNKYHPAACWLYNPHVDVAIFRRLLLGRLCFLLSINSCAAPDEGWMYERCMGRRFRKGLIRV